MGGSSSKLIRVEPTAGYINVLDLIARTKGDEGTFLYLLEQDCGFYNHWALLVCSSGHGRIYHMVKVDVQGPKPLPIEVAVYKMLCSQMRTRRGEPRLGPRCNKTFSKGIALAPLERSYQDVCVVLDEKFTSLRRTHKWYSLCMWNCQHCVAVLLQALEVNLPKGVKPRSFSLPPFFQSAAAYVHNELLSSSITVAHIATIERYWMAHRRRVVAKRTRDLGLQSLL